jgi:ribosomal protein L16 Arg81 hydroxylase
MILFSRSFIRKRAISFATTASVAAVSLVMAQGPTSAHRIRVATPIQYVADRTDHSSEASFLSENESAMSQMMTDMMVKPTGDVDRDFVAMMIPHHQGAVEMAKAELKYGHNELLRRLSKEIIANQQQEITVMRLAVDDERPLPPGSPAESSASSAPQMSQQPMPQEMMSHETTGKSHDAKPRD